MVCSRGPRISVQGAGKDAEAKAVVGVGCEGLWTLHIFIHRSFKLDFAAEMERVRQPSWTIL